MQSDADVTDIISSILQLALALSSYTADMLLLFAPLPDDVICLTSYRPIQAGSRPLYVMLLQSVLAPSGLRTTIIRVIISMLHN